MPTQLDTTQEVQPLTTFLDKPVDLIRQIKATLRPITLTVEGQPAVILQEPAEYQRLLDLAAEADEEEGLRQGLEDIAAGRTRPAREVFAELREEYGIRG
jgi:PHD/YefM family antitoxin component YafN of YafNO toxin-antitoxin module